MRKIVQLGSSLTYRRISALTIGLAFLTSTPSYAQEIRSGTPNGRARVAKQMTPAQIAEAERLAQEWLVAHPER